jgi:hypothetical protein
MALNTGSSSPGELEMMRSTSDVAFCCSSSSSRSRLSNASFLSLPATDEGKLRATSGALRRFDSRAVFLRFFIASPVITHVRRVM